MKKSIIICASLVLLVVLGFSFKASTVTAPQKITICHIPPGNPANCHEITISVNALQTHIDHHGDRLVCHQQQELQYYSDLANATHIELVTAF